MPTRLVQITYAPYQNIGNVVGGNYTAIETDGTMAAHGDATCYRDELQQLAGSRLESPASHIILSAAEAALTFKQTCIYPTDYAFMSIQLNHDWMLGGAIQPHLHWWQVSAATPNWVIEYRWQIQGAAKTAGLTPAAWVSNAFTYDAGTLNQITVFADITPPVGYGQVSDIIQFRLYRDMTNVSTLFSGADPVAADIDAVNFDVHIQIDMLGSRQRYVK